MEDLIGVGTLFLIFGIVLILAGIYIFTGHKNPLIFGRAWVSAKNATKEELRRIGKIILIIAGIICLISVILLLIANHQEKSPAVSQESGEKTPAIESNNVGDNNQENIVTKVAYANWRSEDTTFGADEGCLNMDRFIFSDYPRLAVYKLDTKAQLDSFKEKYKNDFTMDQSHDEVPSFNDVTQNYDDEFFTNNSLILTYKEASSGALRFKISKVIKENGTLILKVVQTNNPEVYTEDMSGCFLMAEVSKDYLKDCKSFDAHFAGVAENTEEKKVTIPNGKIEKDYEIINTIDRFVYSAGNGIDDEIEVTQYTIEGDPIITTIKYNSEEDSFEVIKDTTQDKFGPQEVSKNHYDNTYKAFAGETTIAGEDYYEFKLVGEDNEKLICRFRHQSALISSDFISYDEVEDMDEFLIEVNNKELIVKIEDNSSSKALIEKLKYGDITIDAHDYGNFEKVGSLGFELPTNDKKITTKAGDVILYQGTELTIYYDTNTWNFTKLGEVTNVDGKELKNILRDGNVTMTLKLKQ